MCTIVECGYIGCTNRGVVKFYIRTRWDSKLRTRVICITHCGKFKRDHISNIKNAELMWGK